MRFGSLCSLSVFAVALSLGSAGCPDDSVGGGVSVVFPEDVPTSGGGGGDGTAGSGDSATTGGPDVVAPDVAGGEDAAQPDAAGPDVIGGEDAVGPVCIQDLECVAVSPDAGPCEEPRCDTESGTCVLGWKADCCQSDGDCQDGPLCSVGACPSPGGACEYLQPPAAGCASDADCAQGDACVEATCDECGQCQVAPVPGCCTDDSECITRQACMAGTCAGGVCAFSPVPGCCVTDGDCGGGDPCIVATCVAAQCQAVAKDPCCVQASDCDDGNPCTVDGCSTDGQCTHDVLPKCCASDAQCDDQDPCTTNACGPDHTCKFTPAPDQCCQSDADCTDQNPCTKDTCAQGACHFEPTPGCCATDQDCNDGKPCTDDFCLVVVGACLNAPKSGCCATDADCDDGNACTTQYCAPGGACIYNPVTPCCAQASDCDDGNVCTVDSCAAGECKHEGKVGCCLTDPTVCDDSDPCTADTCDPNGACQHQAIDECCHSDADCADLNPCTADTCKGNVCQNTKTDPACCVTADDCTKATCQVVSCLANGCVAAPDPTCCTSGADCGDGDPCTQDTCAPDGKCTHPPIAGCCKNASDCDDSNACTSDACSQGQCTHQTVANCCGPAQGSPIMHMGFVPGVVEGWTSNGNNNTFFWREDTGSAVAGPASMLFGNAEGTAYCNAALGGPANGTALLPVQSNGFPSGFVTIPAGASAWLTFWVQLDIRSNPNVDQLTVLVDVVDGGLAPYPVWSKAQVPASQYKTWVPVQVDVSQFAGESLRVWVSFDTVDTQCAGTGPRIDELDLIVADCGSQGGCQGNGDCTSPPSSCYKSQGQCQNKQCVYEPKDACCEKTSDCNDGDSCTTDSCVAGVCTNTAVAGCCHGAADCPAPNGCQQGSCSAGTCSYAYVPGPGCCAQKSDCAGAAGFCGDAVTCVENACTLASIDKSQTLANFVFTDGTDGWSANPNWTFWRWRETSAKSVSPSISMYFGDSGAGAYCPGAIPWNPEGEAYLPASDAGFSVDASGKTVLRFQVFLDVRPNANVDILTVLLRPVGGGSDTPIWVKTALSSTQYKQWVPVEVDLTAYAPFSGRLVFRFQVVDRNANGGCQGSGVYVDDVKVTQSCAQ